MKIVKENGFILISEEDDEIIIEKVEAYNKRQGTGTELVKEAIAIAEEKGKKLTLCAYPQDDSIELYDLVSFYERLGFDVEYDTGSEVLMYMEF